MCFTLATGHPDLKRIKKSKKIKDKNNISISAGLVVYILKKTKKSVNETKIDIEIQTVTNSDLPFDSEYMEYDYLDETLIDG